LAFEENNPKVCKSSKDASRTVSESTIVVHPDPLSLLSTLSAMATLDQQSPGPSASFLKSEETPENTERDPNTLEPAGKRDIQMKYSSD
jgi:hypothetical protein